METYFTENGTYVGATVAKLELIEPTLSSATFVNVEAGAFKPAPTANEYTITTEGSNPEQTFTVKNAAGTLTFPCTKEGKGGCPVGGWG
jgi:hypothetical protein